MIYGVMCDKTKNSYSKKGSKQAMELWIKEAKKLARCTAENELVYLRHVATENNLEFDWFFDEFIACLRSMKNRNGEEA